MIRYEDWQKLLENINILGEEMALKEHLDDTTPQLAAEKACGARLRAGAVGFAYHLDGRDIWRLDSLKSSPESISEEALRDDWARYPQSTLGIFRC